ncbi:MAG: tryptophan-rich sensory protein [Pyrinomonadaceae bacterium]|nr:tryptophan-rich sensory protein [Pyrinomonadaceae bacterium]
MIARTGVKRSRFQWLGLVVSIVVCFGVAALGSLLTDPNIDGWYAALRKPPWNPPNWVFGPVWSVLYLLMAVAAWLVWRRRDFARVSLPLALFGVQLVLNGLWSVLFFGWHRPDLALIEIVFLWSAILATMLAFRRVVPLATRLLVPYLLWVSFAAVLNFTIWRMNS